MPKEDKGNQPLGLQDKLPGPAELLQLATNLYERAKADLDANVLTQDYDYLKEYQLLVTVSKRVCNNDIIIYALPIALPGHYQGVPGIIPGWAEVNPRVALSWVVSQTQQLQTRLAQIAGEPGKAQVELLKLGLGFMADEGLKEVVVLDFAEAQQALGAAAPKAAAILCGSAIEGMLVDTLNRGEVLGDNRTQQFFAAKDKARYWRAGSPNWDAIPLRVLYEWAERLSLLRPAVLNLARSVSDFRNTVHPWAEVRDQARAHLQEAAILLQVVQLISAELGSKAAD